ncbi:auxilin-like clathrin-binding protein required for normal clathrin function [Massospora cicadina]|nr:auxilin-like clathrin-binding protein required for normal clathrin function [Massospora cicadina]
MRVGNQTRPDPFTQRTSKDGPQVGFRGSGPASQTSPHSSGTNAGELEMDPFADLACFQPPQKGKPMLQKQLERNGNLRSHTETEPVGKPNPTGSLPAVTSKVSDLDLFFPGAFFFRGALDLEYLTPRSQKSPASRPFDGFDFGAPSQDPIKSNSAEEVDDILGLLGKPVEEVQRLQGSTGISTLDELDHKLAKLVALGHDIEVAKLSLELSADRSVEGAHELILQHERIEMEFSPRQSCQTYEAGRDSNGASPPAGSRSYNSTPTFSPIPSLFKREAILNQAGEMGSSVLSAANSILLKSKRALRSKWEEIQARSSSGHATPASAWSASEAGSYYDDPGASFFAEDDEISKLAQNNGFEKSPRVGAPPGTAPSEIKSKPKPQDAVEASQDQLCQSDEARQAGNAKFKLGQYSEAIEFYNQAIERLPAGHSRQISLHNNRATAWAKLGDFKNSAADADSAIGILGEDRLFMPETRNPAQGRAGLPLRELYAKAVTLKARALENMERYKEAEATYTLILGLASLSLGAQAQEGVRRCRKALQSQGGPSAPRPIPPVTVSSAEVDESASVRKLRAKEAQLAAEEAHRFEVGDEVEARALAWRRGREGNLRALLSSLDSLVWPELQWKRVGLQDLLEPKAVKRHYLRAVAKVHPDKVLRLYLLTLSIQLPASTPTQHKVLAGHIFNSLNLAWEAFRSENHC